MRKKIELQLFEYDDGVRPTRITEINRLSMPKRLLRSKDIDGALKEAKAHLKTIGLKDRVQSINITTDGTIRAILRKNKRPDAKTPPGWRMKRP